MKAKDFRFFLGVYICEGEHIQWFFSVRIGGLKDLNACPVQDCENMSVFLKHE